MANVPEEEKTEGNSTDKFYTMRTCVFVTSNLAVSYKYVVCVRNLQVSWEMCLFLSLLITFNSHE